MKLLETLKNKKTLIYIGILAAGIFVGWLIFGGKDSAPAENKPQENAMSGHNMDQVPQEEKMSGQDMQGMAGMQDDASAQFKVQLSDAAMAIAEITMSPVEKKVPYKEVYLPGKVMSDERKIAQLTARYPGRIEKLHVNYTGQKVTKGQVLANIYSPDLVTAQKELFEAIKFKDLNFKYYDAARQKLKLWSLTEEQIDEIEKSGEVKFYFEVLSPLNGTVTKRNIALGDYVAEGNPLFEIIDLSHLWVMFDAYENDLPWIKLGDRIRFHIKSLPDQEFVSTVTFIDPVLDPMARVTKVRTELDNQRDLLKPEMLASGILRTMLPRSKEAVVVPRSAILWTGKKAIVYVMSPDHNNMFQYREVELGAEAGNYWVVKSGLAEGEMVASNGVFKIDAAAQLKGEKSMMNPEGGKISMGMAGMDMGEDKNEKKNEKGADKKSNDMAGMKMDNMIDEKFKEQFSASFVKYLLIKDALVSSNLPQAKASATELTAAIEKIDMSLLKGDLENQWMGLLAKLNDGVSGIKNSTSLEGARQSFAVLSEAFYDAAKIFGLSQTAYYQFCPMAFDSKGAYWLSQQKEIKNPYFGKAMLTCGETKETLKK